MELKRNLPSAHHGQLESEQVQEIQEPTVNQAQEEWKGP